MAPAIASLRAPNACRFARVVRTKSTCARLRATAGDRSKSLRVHGAAVGAAPAGDLKHVFPFCPLDRFWYQLLNII